MIVVKVELHSAITGKVSEIGRMEICNTGEGTSEVGEYSVCLMRRMGMFGWLFGGRNRCGRARNTGGDAPESCPVHPPLAPRCAWFFRGRGLLATPKRPAEDQVTLSNTAILRHMDLGSIVIEPFDPRAVHK